MNFNNDAFSIYLLERWRAFIFGREIFPSFPFKKSGWRAVAFNRNNHGARLPPSIFQGMEEQLRKRTGENCCFVASPYPVIGGLVALEAQPFVIPFEADEMERHFRDPKYYLPEFFMVGASEDWAVWGDSDMTVMGGKSDLISGIVADYGGKLGIIEVMRLDFDLTGSTVDDQMRSYIEAL